MKSEVGASHFSNGCATDSHFGRSSRANAFTLRGWVSQACAVLQVVTGHSVSTETSLEQQR
jgi:hypothetical protein